MTRMNFQTVAAAARGFVAQRVTSVVPLGCGHIHQTWLVTTAEGSITARYTIQRLNTAVFPEPERVATTVARVAAHQHRRLAATGCPDAHRRALTVLPAADGRPWMVDDEGGHWRAFLHIGRARSHSRVATPALAGQVARVAARFLVELDDLGEPAITDAIPGFRDFGGRQAALDAVVTADEHDRAAGCGSEIDAVSAHRGLLDELAAARVGGRLPLRTVHNDAKADNVLVDEVTGEGLCMVDLDTVALGTVLYDVGDLVRTAAAGGHEDDPTALPPVRPALLEAVLTAYLGTAGALLTPGEIDLLPLAGPLMTFEAAIRFLTDHLAGDFYYRTSRPGHNLDRARAQLRLLDALVGARQRTADLVGQVVGERG